MITATSKRTPRYKTLPANVLVRLSPADRQRLTDEETASVRADRDRQIERLQKKYGATLTRLTQRLQVAEDRLSREEAKHQQKARGQGLSTASELLGVLLGGRRMTTTVNRPTPSVALQRAREAVRAIHAEVQQLQEDCQAERDQRPEKR